MIENILSAILFGLLITVIVGPFVVAIWAVFKK